MNTSADVSPLRSRYVNRPLREERVLEWRDGVFAVLSFVGPLFLYIMTLAPTVTLEDSGEFITAAYHLGIPHAPGYPLWCMLAHLFTGLSWGNVAERIHLFSAVCGAGACLVTFLIARRLTGDAWAALAGAWVLGASRYLWSQSVVAEVYSLNALLFALCLWTLVEWQDSRREFWLLLLSLFVGLGASNHFLMLLFAPVFVAWVLAVDWKVVTRPLLVVSLLLAFAMGLAPYAYLPIRASADPVPNLGDPDTFEKFWAHVSRSVYSTGEETIRQGGTFTDAMRHSGMAFVRHYEAFNIVFILLAVGGFVVAVRRHFAFALATLAIVLLNDVVLNFMLGERFNAGWSFVHRVYYISSDVCLALWIAVCFSVANTRKLESSFISPTAAMFLCIAGLVWMNFSYCDRSQDRVAEQVGKDFLRSLPKNAVVASLDDFLYPLLYLTKVEGYRADVQIGSPSFGYDPRRPSNGFYSMIPITPAVAEFTKAQIYQETTSIPEGLAYRVVKGAGYHPPTASFRTLDPPPAVPPRSTEEDDVFGLFARGMVANYYTRVGAKYLVEGKMPEAEKAFDEAERLVSNAYSYWLLATTYRDRKFRLDRVCPLLKKAVELHDRFYDPASERFAPVSGEQIRADWQAACPQGISMPDDVP